MLCAILYVPFVQFKKHEKYPWTSDTFSAKACNSTRTNTRLWVLFTFHVLVLKPATLLELTLAYGCFSRSFSFAIDNTKPTCLYFKFHELFQIAQSIICYILVKTIHTGSISDSHKANFQYAFVSYK